MKFCAGIFIGMGIAYTDVGTGDEIASPARFAYVIGFTLLLWRYLKVTSRRRPAAPAATSPPA